jgi:hypothetical protein
MDANHYDGGEHLSNDLASVADELHKRMVIPNTRLKVVFENAEIVWLGHDRIEPFYVAEHDYLRDGPEPRTPNEILKHLAQGSWSHFIWLPRWLCQSDVPALTMRYAHELQHYRQVIDPESVRRARQFFRYLKEQGFVPALEMEVRPAEFDAHRVALESFKSIHGKDALDSYISMESEDPIMKRFYQRLAELTERLSAWTN